MLNRRYVLRCAAVGGLSSLLPLTALSQEAKVPAQVLFGPHGGVERFPKLYARALNVFINAEEEYHQGRYDAASALIDKLFADVPVGSSKWSEADAAAADSMAISGLNIGLPPCYYALRMLADCCAWKLAGETPEDAKKVVWTIVMPGGLEGKQPRNNTERANKAGPVVRCELDPRIKENDYQIVRQSTRLFSEYVSAITRGRLDVKLNFLPLADLTVPGVVNAAPDSVAGITGDGFGKIWEAVPAAVKAKTDWWWILYPSNVPEQFPDFRSTEFITGGMGSGLDGKSPCFIIDDRWLLRKPPHLGHGDMHPLERRSYLPQWLQHEFFHHLYARYPALRLETAKGHDWFDRQTWPRDFVGEFEPDYYYESLHKRILKARLPLHIALKYVLSDLSQVFTPEMIAGRYRREPVENDWHRGELTIEPASNGKKFRWKNQAGVSFLLESNLKSGSLLTAPDSPYFDTEEGKRFVLELKRRKADESPELLGFRYNGDLYRRVER